MINYADPKIGMEIKGMGMGMAKTQIQTRAIVVEEIATSMSL